DYGVVGASAAIRSLETASADAKPLVEPPALKLPLPRRRATEGTARLSRDLTAHPWAGGEVAMTLTATDDAGQQGLSEEVTFTLPQRVFTKPLARAVVYERRRLAVDIANRASVAEMLDIVTTTHPDEFIPNKAHYLALRMAYRIIDREREVEPLREALDLLWDTALAIEDGNLSAAERRLRDAQEKLAEALENGASDDEIERLMQELREAMADFMREFAQNQQQNQQQNAMQNQNAENLRTQDLDEMMKRIEDLAKSGSRDAARELLREMQRMMNNLQMAQPQQGGQQDPMSEQMNKLGEMMREQQQLMDETFQMQQQQQRSQQQQQQGQQGEQQQSQNGEQGEQRPMTAEEFAEAMKRLQEQQGQLQQQMEEMQDAMRGMGVDPGEQLGEAGEAMGGAEQELGQGNTGEATGEQGRALQAMRQGAQQMLQNMQSQQGEQAGSPGERGQHGEQSRRERDPLGRRAGNQGPRIGDDVKVPGEIDAQRAREILEAIRKRLGETARPKLELDYLDRLLPTR
ncbi:MAG: TIGR02302 family protein, partial [Pseudomonadota bacterium]